MDFSQFSSNATTIGLETGGCVLLMVLAYKLFKMKIHSKSGCCGDKFVIETMNTAGSSRDFEFTVTPQPKNKTLEKNKSFAVI